MNTSLNNFEINEQANMMVMGSTPYKLARTVMKCEEKISTLEEEVAHLTLALSEAKKGKEVVVDKLNMLNVMLNKQHNY